MLAALKFLQGNSLNRERHIFGVHSAINELIIGEVLVEKHGIWH